jgi:L-ascorbate metabolism protein UlaG (beta-lactamase superfamily)
MKLTWLGHSCFFIETENSTRIMCDPSDEATGYDIVPRECEMLLISHPHHDHNNAALALGDYYKIEGPGEYEARGVKVTGLETYHDHHCGKRRGCNTVYVIEADGLKIVHMGDIGEIPDERTMAAIKNADVLLIPVGGVYTVGGEEAAETVRLASPKVAVPMHYKTDALRFELEELSGFINNISGYYVEYAESPSLTVSKGGAIGKKVIVLKYEGQK